MTLRGNLYGTFLILFALFLFGLPAFRSPVYAQSADHGVRAVQNCMAGTAPNCVRPPIPDTCSFTDNEPSPDACNFAVTYAHTPADLVTALSSPALCTGRAGLIIALDSGATYTRTSSPGWTLAGGGAQPNNNPCNNPIIIRPNIRDTLMPPKGVRVTSSYFAAMPKLTDTSNNSAIIATQSATAASGYYLLGVELAESQAVTTMTYLAQIGNLGETDYAHSPTNIVFDRMYIHGNACTAAGVPYAGCAGKDDLGTGVELDVAGPGDAPGALGAAVIDSYIGPIMKTGNDCQAIDSLDGGALSIINNYLSAATEVFMAGGADPPVRGHNWNLDVTTGSTRTGGTTVFTLCSLANCPGAGAATWRCEDIPQPCVSDGGIISVTYNGNRSRGGAPGNGSCVDGSTNIHDADFHFFTPDMVGMKVSLPGCASGAELDTTITGYVGPQDATIAVAATLPTGNMRISVGGQDYCSVNANYCNQSGMDLSFIGEYTVVSHTATTATVSQPNLPDKNSGLGLGGGILNVGGGLVHDLFFVQNRLYKDWSWFIKSNTFVLRQDVKNIFELKQCRNCIVQGNCLLNNWADGQVGMAFDITPRTGAFCPQCTVHDVEIAWNVIAHAGQGFNISGQDSPFPNGGGWTVGTFNLNVHDDLFLDIPNKLYATVTAFISIANGSASSSRQPPYNLTFNHLTQVAYEMNDGTAGEVASFGDNSTTTAGAFTYTYQLLTLNTKIDNSILASGPQNFGGTGTPFGTATINAYMGSTQTWNTAEIKNNLWIPPGSRSTDNNCPANIACSGNAYLRAVAAGPFGAFSNATPLSAIGFLSAARGIYQLASTSTYHNGGTDGQDIGITSWATLLSKLSPADATIVYGQYIAPGVKIGKGTLH
jgi:hypothetical protein